MQCRTVSDERVLQRAENGDARVAIRVQQPVQQVHALCTWRKSSEREHVVSRKLNREANEHMKYSTVRAGREAGREGCDIAAADLREQLTHRERLHHIGQLAGQHVEHVHAPVSSVFHVIRREHLQYEHRYEEERTASYC